MQNLLKLTENKKLSKSQKKILEYLLKEYDKAAYMTACELAKTVGVSESTAVRFAACLGFDGFSELSKYLKETAGRQLTAVQRMQVSDTRIDDAGVLDTVLGDDINKIRKTLETLDREAFNNTVDAVCSARRIYIIGVRSAGALASFFAYYLNHICDNVSLLTTISGVEILEQLVRVREGDVAVVISFPRYSKRIIRAAEYAKMKGAVVCALTDGPDSPIADIADYRLYARSDMVSFADSLAAPMSVLNALIVSIGRKKKDDVEKVYSELEGIWEAQGVYEKGEKN